MAIPFIIPVGVLAVVGWAIAAASGGESGEVRPVVPLKTKKQKRAGRTALCTCYRGGAQEFYALSVCALRAIYPDADNDWRPLLDLALDDSKPMDPGTRKAVKWVRARATALLRLQTEEERLAWCGEEEEGETDGTLPPPPPPGPGRLERIRELFLAARSQSPGGASFWTPVQGESDSQGMLATSRAVLRSYGIGSPTNQQRTAYARLMEAVPYNQRLYGRTRKSNETIHHLGKTVRALYLPRHEDAAAAIMAGRAPKRTIYDNGNKISGSGGSRYGMPWLPGLDEGALASGFVVADPATAEPPAELLELLEEG